MGLLEDLLASVTTQPTGGMPRERAQAGAGGLDMGAIMMALMPIVLAMLGGRRSGAPPPGGGGTASGGLGDLGSLLGSLLGQGGAGGTGGLGDLLAQLQRAGLGEQAQSWVGRGQNQPLPSNAIDQVFGRGGLAEIARRAGLTEADASRGLSQLLPEVVDRVTPDGQVPDTDALVATVQALGRRFGVA